MKNTLVLSAVIFTIGFVAFPVIWGDDSFRWGQWGEYKHRETNIASLGYPIYQKECGSCHMVYPPGLLPATSWTKLMAGLDHHFGDNAELDTETIQSLSEYILSNSADQSKYRRSQKFMRSLSADNVPIRISETPYFRHEHDEIPLRIVSGNVKIQSFSNCNACHLRAEEGSFNEHEILIPGYGRWDD